MTFVLRELCPASVLQQVDTLCDLFEERWREGIHPRIEDLLQALQGEAHELALYELLRLELHYRCKTGEFPAQQEYQSRFPGHNASIASAFSPQADGDPLKGNTPEADVTGLVGPDQSQLLPNGHLIREYRIEAPIGRGGMGQVYRAHHVPLNRTVAVKVLIDELAKNPAAIRRFQKSVELQGQLDHPNLAQALDAFAHEGQFFLVMEYVPGPDLAILVRQEGPLAVDRVCDYVRQAAQGLEHAHSLNIVHRDVKPSNLILNPSGTIKVVDLGLARHDLPADQKDSAGSLPSAGIVGTIDYLAPEQADNAASADNRSDLYSLGCTFYYLLTGRPPFAKGSLREKLNAHAEETPQSVRDLRPDVPIPIADVVHKLLAKKPEDRFPSARALIDALEDAQRAKAEESKAEGPVAPVPKSPRKWFGAALVAITFLLLPLAYFFGPQVIRIATNKGELIIETDDPAIEVIIKQGGATIIDSTTRRRIDLKVGDYDIELSEAKQGLQLSTKKFTLTRGGRAVVKVSWEPPSKQPKTPAGSPLDMLDPKAIPESERFNWQPKELVAVIGEHRQRNWGQMLTLSVHPKGDRVAVFTDPGEGRYWEVPSGKALWVNNLPEGYFFHPDGKTLLGWTERIWDVSGEKPVVVGENPSRCEFFSTSRDGRLILAWTRSHGYVHVLDGSDPRKIKQVGKIANTEGAAVSPHGKLVAVAARGTKGWYTVRILDWDGKETQFRVELPEQRRPAYQPNRPAFCFAPDGRLGVCNEEGVFKLWDVGGKEPKLVLATSKVDAEWPVFSPDGKRVALASQSRIQIWRIDADKLEKTSEIHMEQMRLNTSHVQSVAFLPDSNRIVTGHLNGVVRHWDITEKQPKEINPIKPGVSARFEVSSDGKRLISVAADKRLTRYVFGGAEPQLQLFAGAYFGDPGNARITSDTSVVSLDYFNGKVFQLLDEPTELTIPTAHVITLSGNGSIALIATRDGNKMSLWSLIGKREQLTDWVERSSDSSHLIAPNGRHVLQHDPKGTISLWRYSDKKLAKTSEVRIGSIAGMTFSPDGKAVAVFPIANPILHYEVRDDKLVPLPPTTYGRLHGDGCFSPDGKLLARCGHGAVHVYDYPSGKVRHEWKFPGIVQRALFAPDNRHLFVLGYNGVLYILRLPPPPTAAEVEAAWLKMVADLAAEKQIEAVRDKLVDLNPGYDGKSFCGSHETGAVRSVTFLSENVKDISPLRAFPKLEFLDCSGSPEAIGQIADLTPLKGMKLRGMHCEYTQIADLTPLTGMPLQYLTLTGTRVSNLAPLKTMRLTAVTANKTPVADITPLTGMKLDSVSIGHTHVSDLSPLKGMSLYGLDCSHTKVENLAPLKDMPLARLSIAYTKVPDLALLEGMKLTHLECDGTRVKDLSPLKDMKLTHLRLEKTPVADLAPLAGMKLKEFACGGTQVTSLQLLKGMPLEVLSFSNTSVSDLKPLEGMPLTFLDGEGTPVSNLSPLKAMMLETVHVSNTKVTNLSALKGMPIRYLKIAGLDVADLSPLKEMRLRYLHCTFKADRDAEILRSIKTLEKINGKPAAEFWKELDAKKADNRP